MSLNEADTRAQLRVVLRGGRTQRRPYQHAGKADQERACRPL